jgi:hypothetical protein
MNLLDYSEVVNLVVTTLIVGFLVDRFSAAGQPRLVS